jgi:hypothetical protein
MAEEENNQSVEEAVAQPSESGEQQDVQQEEVQRPSEHVIDDQERNWKEARRKLQELERRTIEQDEVIRRMQGQQQKPIDEDETAKLADDDIITVKQHRESAAKIARQVAKEVIKLNEASTVDERMRSRFPDYEDVITPENIQVLKRQDPELVQSLEALNHDPYAQAVAAYKMLKRTGIGDMAKQQPQKAKAIENSKKPVSVQSVTKSSAIGNVYNFENGLTPELRKQLQKEMEEASKRA